MLEEYRELCRVSANIIPNWTKMSKNDLCRAYVENKGNEYLQNAYFSAVLYKYWSLIAKYHFMSANCATPEDCYEWLVDSVACCLNLAAWENPEASIYKDPNGPDKVINRCMKCARLTYYQFINRKKRRDNFNMASIDDLQEQFGVNTVDPVDPSQEIDITGFMISDYIVTKFLKKDYFVAFLLGAILTSSVFDGSVDDNNKATVELNLRKLVKVMSTLDKDFLEMFSSTYELPYEDVNRAFQYIKAIPQANMRKKVVQTLENLRHSNLAANLIGGSHVN